MSNAESGFTFAVMLLSLVAIKATECSAANHERCAVACAKTGMDLKSVDGDKCECVTGSKTVKP